MKKQQLIIVLSVLLLLVLVYFMGRDLFRAPQEQGNPAEYNIDKYRVVDSSKICYHEIKQIPVQLEELNGMAIDRDGNIYVTGDKEIQIFNSNWERKGGFSLDTFASCLGVSHRQTLLIGMGSQLEEYDRDGKKLALWKSLNDKGFITSVVQAGDFIFAADAGNKILLKYDDSGNLLQEIGKKDTARHIDGFLLPSPYFDVAIGPGDDLWVSNPGRHQIQNFSETGNLITTWGEATIQLEGFAGCCNPAHFTILSDGCFVTYEKGMDRIKIYNRAGIFVCVVDAPTTIDESALVNCSLGAKVNALAVDRDGHILALDAKLKMIRVFEKIN